MEKITVMSKKQAIQYSATKDIDQTAIISIYSLEKGPCHFFRNPQIIHIAKWQFEDEEDEPMGMTELQAKQIAAFVNRNIDIPYFIVNCDAGISRSAGVAAAISLFVFGTDDNIFLNPIFAPNKRCYKLMLNAFNIHLSDEKIAAKYQKNIEKFREHFPDLVD